MSYMSGIMMGFALGKGIRQFLFARSGAINDNITGTKIADASKKVASVPLFSLASKISGRRRYYASALVQNDGLAELLEDKLSKLKNIDEVKINTVTGSILLIYHGNEELVDALVDWLSEHIFSPSPSSTAVSEGLASIGMSIRRTVASFNTCIKRATNSVFDLSSLLALFFIVGGIKKFLVAPVLPSGVQLIWWAFSLLRGWRMV